MDNEYEIMLKTIGVDKRRHKKDSDSTRRPTRKVDRTTHGLTFESPLEGSTYDIEEEQTPVESIEAHFTNPIEEESVREVSLKHLPPHRGCTETAPISRPPGRKKRTRQTIAMSPWRDNS